MGFNILKGNHLIGVRDGCHEVLLRHVGGAHLSRALIVAPLPHVLCPSLASHHVTMVSRLVSTLAIIFTKIQHTRSGNMSLTEDLQWLNKLGLLRTNLLSQQNAENLAINAHLKKQNYSHFYDPSRIKFYFTDSEKSPLKKAELFIHDKMTTTATTTETTTALSTQVETDGEKEMIENATDQNAKINMLSSLPYPIWINSEKSKKKVLHSKEKIPRIVNRRFHDRKIHIRKRNHSKVNYYNYLNRLKSGIMLYKNRISSMISKKHLIEVAAFVLTAIVMSFL